MKIWKKEFEATYIRDDGVAVLDDSDIPLPKDVVFDKNLRSNVIFPPNTRAGDHYHTKRHELFVGFGKGMEFLYEDRESGKIQVIKMDPAYNDGQYLAIWMKPGMAHAVRNSGNEQGYLIEFASHPAERVAYKISA